MGRPSKYVIDRDTVVDLLINKGLSVPLASKQLNCTSDALRYFIEKHNIEVPKGTINTRTSLIKFIDPIEVKQLLDNGYTYSQIADKYSCTVSSVSTFIKQHNLKSVEPQNVVTEAELRKLYCEDCKSIQEISIILGISSHVISKYLKQLSIMRSEQQQR